MVQNDEPQQDDSFCKMKNLIVRKHRLFILVYKFSLIFKLSDKTYSLKKD